MKKLQLSLACGALDRTRPILDGRIEIEGCEVTPIPLAAEEAFHRAFHFGEFAVSELSMSSYIARLSTGDTRYRAIPVFTSRLFRHSSIYVHRDSGIRTPADLKGRIVGLPEYAMTAALWVRGFLEDDFGVRPQDLRWRAGGLYEPGRVPKANIVLPETIELKPIPPDETLNNMLASGELPALISARPPRSFLAGDGRVQRLFKDSRSVEREYFARTGIFPIMHLIAIRADYLETHPWLASSVLKAFERAKRMAIEDLEDGHALNVMLPWLEPELSETRSLMGADFWPYGVEANRKTLTAMVRYAFAHGTASRQLTPEELFVPSSLAPAKT